MQLVIRTGQVRLPSTGALVELGQVDQYPQLYAVGADPEAVFDQLVPKAVAAFAKERPPRTPPAPAQGWVPADQIARARVCAAPGCRNQFRPTTPTQRCCSDRCQARLDRVAQAHQQHTRDEVDGVSA